MGYGNGGYEGSADMQARSMEQLRTATQQPRQSAIALQAVTMEKRVESLLNVVSELEQRLSGVTMPEASAAIGNKLPAEIHSPVVFAQHLGAMNERLDAALVRLTSLLNRIEL